MPMPELMPIVAIITITFKNLQQPMPILQPFTVIVAVVTLLITVTPTVT